MSSEERKRRRGRLRRRRARSGDRTDRATLHCGADRPHAPRRGSRGARDPAPFPYGPIDDEDIVDYHRELGDSTSLRFGPTTSRCIGGDARRQSPCEAGHRGRPGAQTYQKRPSTRCNAFIRPPRPWKAAPCGGRLSSPDRLSRVRQRRPRCPGDGTLLVHPDPTKHR